MPPTFTKFPEGEIVVALVVFQNTLMLATSKGVYQAKDQNGPFTPVEFVEKEAPDEDDEIPF